MSKRYVDHAKALYAFCEREWTKRAYTSPTTWARTAGIPPVTLLSWRDRGGDVGMASMRQVAAVLNVSLIKVLVEAGYLEADEAGVPVIPDFQYDVLDAIRLDPKLSPHEREALRQVHDAFATVESGKKSQVRVRPK